MFSDTHISYVYVIPGGPWASRFKGDICSDIPLHEYHTYRFFFPPPGEVDGLYNYYHLPIVFKFSRTCEMHEVPNCYWAQMLGTGQRWGYPS